MHFSWTLASDGVLQLSEHRTMAAGASCSCAADTPTFSQSVTGEWGTSCRRSCQDPPRSTSGRCGVFSPMASRPNEPYVAFRRQSNSLGREGTSQVPCHLLYNMSRCMSKEFRNHAFLFRITQLLPLRSTISNQGRQQDRVWTCTGARPLSDFTLCLRGTLMLLAGLQMLLQRHGGRSYFPHVVAQARPCQVHEHAVDRRLDIQRHAQLRRLLLRRAHASRSPFC